MKIIQAVFDPATETGLPPPWCPELEKDPQYQAGAALVVRAIQAAYPVVADELGEYLCAQCPKRQWVPAVDWPVIAPPANPAGVRPTSLFVEFARPSRLLPQDVTDPDALAEAVSAAQGLPERWGWYCLFVSTEAMARPEAKGAVASWAAPFGQAFGEAEAAAWFAPDSPPVYLAACTYVSAGTGPGGRATLSGQLGGAYLVLTSGWGLDRFRIQATFRPGTDDRLRRRVADALNEALLGLFAALWAANQPDADRRWVNLAPKALQERRRKKGKKPLVAYERLGAAPLRRLAAERGMAELPPPRPRKSTLLGPDGLPITLD